VPDSLEGTSFAPLIDNPGFQWKTAVFSQVSRTVGDLGRSVTTADGRYNYWRDKGEELYQHQTDPEEYNNLAGVAGDSAALNNMRRILADGWSKIIVPKYKKLTRYRDADNDGYGAAGDTLLSYASMPGYVLNNKDCDDTDPSANPGAPEICDGKDNNCDGFTDEICLPDISMKNQSISEGNSGLNNMIFEVNLSHAYNQNLK
jgi:hypothetical protein